MGGTSAEEIERQHAQAIQMIRSSSITNHNNDDELYPMILPMIDRGAIPLEWKIAPTIQNPSFLPSISIQQQQEQQQKQVQNKDEELLLYKQKHARGSCISSRGMIDVQPLLDIITEGCHDPPVPPSTDSDSDSDSSSTKYSTTNLWDETNARINNVHITRKSHDAWGIKKITLIYCDDFLQTIYEMPWWHSPPQNCDLRNAIQPILHTLQIQNHQIVRLLLAALPPGVTIPVHHDTGEWVRQSHRVHVPILVTDHNQILFRCGPSEECMDRVSCLPGHVFEMNNQGKHAVSNCHETDYRVHLILDYVDDDNNDNDNTTTTTSIDRRNRIKLEPGEVLIQTRRSIDRAIDENTRPTPSYMILGAQKSGTTSLYEYINEHPLVVRAKRRETHCLDWRWDECIDDGNNTNIVEKRREHCQSFFHKQELSKYPSLLTGDSTPSYLLDSYRCIPRLKEVFPWEGPYAMKFICIFRDPVKRAISHREMVTSSDGTEEQKKARGTEWLHLSFEEIVKLDMTNMKQSGLIPYWDVQNEEMDLEIFQGFVGSEEENQAYQRYLKDFVPMMTGSHSLISRGMYELQLRQWLNEFSQEQFLVLTLEDMKRGDVEGEAGQGGVHRMMDKVWNHLNLPNFEVKDVAPKNTRNYKDNVVSDETKEMLKRFYAPHNSRLEVLLGSDWTNPW